LPETFRGKLYCTLALTVEFPFSVNVQLAVLFALHAPVQIATRPPETVSFTTVPAASEVDPVLGTAALIPEGVEVTELPLRPLVTTVSVAAGAGGGGGFSVKTADWVTPPPETEIVPCVRVVTAEVWMLKRAEVLPAGINSELGTVMDGLLLATWKIWSLLAGAAVVTVTKAAVPPAILDWLSVTEAG
jgi:hypothetical protein